MQCPVYHGAVWKLWWSALHENLPTKLCLVLLGVALECDAVQPPAWSSHCSAPGDKDWGSTRTWLRDREAKAFSCPPPVPICIKLNTVWCTFRSGCVLRESIPPSCSLNCACIVSAARKYRHSSWTTGLLKVLGVAFLVKAVKSADLLCLWWLHHFETTEGKSHFPVLLFQSCSAASTSR